MGATSKVLALGLWLIIALFPLYWIVVTSLKGPEDIFSSPIQYWPKSISFANYQDLFQKTEFHTFMLNSFVVAFIAGLIATAIAAMSAYVLSRFHFKGKGAMMGAFLVTQMIPTFIALGPLYQMMVFFGFVDMKIGLILVYIAICIPFCTIMLRGFFANIPASLDEAARIDGCNRFTLLTKVIVPVMRPGLIAAFIFNFVNCWNELFLSVTLMNREQNKTIPAALNGFITSYNIDWGAMSAAAVLTIIPTMLMFAFASKHIVAGLTAGAVKE